MKTILSAGQCGFDHGNLSAALKAAFPVEVEPLASAAEVLAHLRSRQPDLVLVNRIFDATGEDGIGLIRRIKAEPALARVPVMLVSNYENYQKEAVAAGAVPGFGKSAIGQPAMLQAVASALGEPG